MGNIKGILYIIYMPLETWTKVCVRVLFSHVKRFVYTYMEVYDVGWRSDGDGSLLVSVSGP